MNVPSKTALTKMSPEEFVRAAIKLFSNTNSGLYSEGLTLRLLEGAGVPIVRGEESAVCDAAILLHESRCEKSLLGTLYKSVDENIDVIPFDLKRKSMTLRSEASVQWLIQSGIEQKKVTQFFLVEISGCHNVRILIPQVIREAIQANQLDPMGAYASKIPPGFLSCVVHCRDLAEAFNRIAECVVDPGKVYINPTTLAEFEAGMFRTIPARDALLARNAQTGERAQIRQIYEDVTRHGLVCDVHPIPLIISDFVIHIAGSIISFEAKLNNYDINAATRTMNHIIAWQSPNGSFRRRFHHTQTFQYLFTQSSMEAYIIPEYVLPDAFYAADTVTVKIPLAHIDSFRVDLTQEDWVADLVAIVERTKNSQRVIPRPRCGRHFYVPGTGPAKLSVVDDPIDDADMIDADIVEGEGVDISSAGLNATLISRMNNRESQIYRILMKHCARRRSGIIVPFDQFPTNIHNNMKSMHGHYASYLMVPFCWSPQEALDFELDATWPSFSLSQCSPHTLCIPITIYHQAKMWKFPQMTIREQLLSVLAQPFNQIVIMGFNFDHTTSQLAIIPSECFLPTKQDLKKYVEQCVLQGVHYVTPPLVNVLNELPMQFMRPIRDISEIILSVLQDVDGDGQRNSSPTLSHMNDRMSYVRLYKDMTQHQASQLLKISKSDGVASEGSGGEDGVRDSE